MTPSISSSLEPGSVDVVVDSLKDTNELPWREFLESSFTLRFCCLAVDLVGRLLLELALEVGTEGEAGVGVDWLSAFSYSVIRAPFRRFVPCSCREGVGDKLGEVLVRSRLALPVEDGEVELERGVDPAAAAKAACLPACLILLISAFVGRTIRPFLVLGRAGQLSWLALWGPQQLAHFAPCWQFSPVGPSCPSI